MDKPATLSDIEADTLRHGNCPDCAGDILLVGPAETECTCGECMMGFDVDQGRRLGEQRARAAFYEPDAEPRECDHCGKTYTGPGVYCCIRCAILDA